MSNSLVSKK